MYQKSYVNKNMYILSIVMCVKVISSKNILIRKQLQQKSQDEDFVSCSSFYYFSFR